MEERKWRKAELKDWRGLKTTVYWGMHYLYKSNFVEFTDKIIFKVKKDYGISEEEFKQKNKEFFKKLHEVFENPEAGYSSENEKIQELKELLYLPDCESKKSVNYINAINAFKKLTPEEMSEFKKEIESSYQS